MDRSVRYRAISVNGVSIFYRESGPSDAPVILLLHGLPSSSRMFEPLLTRLSDRFHLIAPDYPGFGHSDAPDPKKFAYTFDHIASLMGDFTKALGLSDYSLYMQDYGGPVGFRLALNAPERVQALIVQNAVAHDGGLALSGPQGEHSGLTEALMKLRCAQTCCHFSQLVLAMWAVTPIPPAMIQISGQMSSHFLTNRTSRYSDGSLL